MRTRSQYGLTFSEFQLTYVQLNPEMINSIVPNHLPIEQRQKSVFGRHLSGGKFLLSSMKRQVSGGDGFLSGPERQMPMGHRFLPTASRQVLGTEKLLSLTDRQKSFCFRQSSNNYSRSINNQ